MEEGAGEEEWRGEMDAELDEGNGRNGSVGGVKVDWNVTGTVLSTAQEDAKVRLWKCECFWSTERVRKLMMGCSYVYGTVAADCGALDRGQGTG